jgi:SAM-dependent methyltransferase/polyhydroxyalkanoate synthesis regulator phasin
MTQSYEVNENSEVYYSGTYWNDYEIVRRRNNVLISGEPTRTWHQHFAMTVGRTFERALILNCGNGWVDRELVEAGLVAAAVGMDYSQALLDEAAAEAAASGLPITYEQANVNTASFPAGPFDLVVNHAAAHHIAAIDRVFREICRVLPDDGWFVSLDYVGPHRNQYDLHAWEEAWRLNRELPPSVRQDLVYPPISAMVIIDPTEAIHSELILETFHRYFTTGQYTAVGGALAYPLLTHNVRLVSADDEERTPWIERILEADDRYLAQRPESTLFAYFSGTPNKSVLLETEMLGVWTKEEHDRERRADANGGEYYERTRLATVLADVEQARAEAAALRDRGDALEAHLASMRSRYLYMRARRLADRVGFREGAAGARALVPEPLTGGPAAPSEVSALSAAQHALDVARADCVSGRARVAALEEQVVALEADPVYGSIRRLLDAGLIRRLRATRPAAAAERRLRRPLRRSY